MSIVPLPLALALRDAGLRWRPVPGDRFVLPGRGMDDDLFVLSDMTVEVHEFSTGSVIGFNGVTEWALDSVEQEEAVWMPSEQQLRERLGGLFVRLEAPPEGGYEVTLRLPDGGTGFPDGGTGFRADGAAAAYATALLAVLREVTASSVGS